MDDRMVEARDILALGASRWERLAVTTSFQASGMVILHMLRALGVDVTVLFLDTGFHFTETLEFGTRVARDWDLDMKWLTRRHPNPQEPADLFDTSLFESDPDRCCYMNKVEPLYRELEDYDAWIAGVRRDQSRERAGERIFRIQMLPSGKVITKIHPLASVTQEDIDAYVARNNLPVHPLVSRGYGSIGCEPCTQPNGGANNREGRWKGKAKTECGIHSISELAGRQRTGTA